MDAIVMTVEVGADRRLVVDLPDEIPVGPVDVVITAHSVTTTATSSARAAAQARLSAAGILSTAHHAPVNAASVSTEERARVWAQFSRGRSSDELIDEERGSR